MLPDHLGGQITRHLSRSDASDLGELLAHDNGSVALGASVDPDPAAPGPEPVARPVMHVFVREVHLATRILQGDTVPGPEQLLLPLGPETGSRISSLRRRSAVPIQHVLNRLGQGPEGEPRLDSLAAIYGQHGSIFPRHPQRQLRERLDSLLLQEVFGYPDWLRAGTADSFALFQQSAHP